jgi:hypothetical protein
MCLVELMKRNERAVSRRLHMAAVRVKSHVRSCGIFYGQNDSGVGFLRVLRFPLLILIPPSSPY